MELSLDTVEIPVAELARAVDWYARALGWRAEWSDERNALLAAPTAGGVRLLLVQTDDPRRLAFHAGGGELEHSVLDFSTGDLDGLHRHLSTLVPGLGPIPEPAYDWAPRGFAFRDSEGNRLAAFARY